MNDIESRLRADATQVDPPPDLHAALRIATARQPRSHAWLAAAAAVIVVVGGVAALTQRHPGSGNLPPAGSADSATDASPPDAAVVGAIVAPRSDPTSRDIVLIIHQPSPDPDTCPSSLPSLIESPTEVRVKLGSPSPESLQPGSCFVQPTTPDGSTVGPARRMNLTDIRGAEYTLYLPMITQPLGARPLIDDATGEPITTLHSDPPTPGTVPGGYTFEHPFVPGSSVSLNFQPGALAPLAVGRYYQDAAGDRLEFVVAASDHVTAGARVVDHATVDGHDATVTETAQTRCVTWSPTPGSGMQVCSDVSQAKPAAGLAGLISETDLLQMADTL